MVVVVDDGSVVVVVEAAVVDVVGTVVVVEVVVDVVVVGAVVVVVAPAVDVVVGIVVVGVEVVGAGWLVVGPPVLPGVDGADVVTAGEVVDVGSGGTEVTGDDVVVEAGGGNVTTVAGPGAGAATGPGGTVVVLAKTAIGDAVAERNVVVGSRLEDPTSSPSICSPWTSSAAGARSRSQLTPAKTANTSAPAARRTMTPEMIRPTTTLSRAENLRSIGSLRASRSAILLARSSGLCLCRPLGWRNEGSFRSSSRPWSRSYDRIARVSMPWPRRRRRSPENGDRPRLGRSLWPSMRSRAGIPALVH